MMLADIGADVLKVEPPAGDDSRGWLPFTPPGEGGAAAESAYFLSANRGKRSVRLDLKSAEGAERLRDLCASADVLVENYRPGLLARLGLDPAELREANPRLVTLVDHRLRCRRPGRHPTGLRPDRPGRGRPDEPDRAGDGDPTRVGLPIADILAGMFGAFGVMAALREREHDRHRPLGRDQPARRGHLGARLPRGRLADRGHRPGDAPATDTPRSRPTAPSTARTLPW